jgi:hypothetical protein
MAQTLWGRLLGAGVAGCFAVGVIAGSTPAFAIDPAAAGSFEYDDGNVSVEAVDRTDWDALGAVRSVADVTDAPTGAQDRSFVKGTKSDTPVPVIEAGAIPANRSDLARMRVATETVNGHVLLYLAWNRENASTAANVNFEFNGSQSTSRNDVTPTRSKGDLLITFDADGNAGAVHLGLARWGQSPCAADAGQSPACWGGLIDLDATGAGDAAVSADGTFGEAVIDLTAAGVFAEGTCQTFASAHLSSRSSSSQSAGLKDYVPPADITLASCGAFAIAATAKHHDPATAPDLEAIFEVRDALGRTLVATATTDSETGRVCVSNVPPGTYSVAETAGLDGYRLAAAAQQVTVTQETTCANTAVSFENVPLSRFTLGFESFVPGGTAAEITCRDENGDLVAAPPDATDGYDDTSEAFTDLPPGVYTCSIDIGP